MPNGTGVSSALVICMWAVGCKQFYENPTPRCNLSVGRVFLESEEGSWIQGPICSNANLSPKREVYDNRHLVPVD